MQLNLAIYDDIPKELKDAVEAVVLNKNPEATDALLDIAEKYRGDGSEKVDDGKALEWRSITG